MSSMREPEACKVAAVTDKAVKIYGPATNGFRPYTGESHIFSTHGKAKNFADEFDTKQREFSGKTSKKQRD